MSDLWPAISIDLLLHASRVVALFAVRVGGVVIVIYGECGNRRAVASTIVAVQSMVAGSPPPIIG